MNTAQINLKSSNDENQHACETCGKAFKSKSPRIFHKRVHSGVNRTTVMLVIGVLVRKVI